MRAPGFPLHRHEGTYSERAHAMRPLAAKQVIIVVKEYHVMDTGGLTRGSETDFQHVCQQLTGR